jgi:ribosomal protein L11 methylase PrmA
VRDTGEPAGGGLDVGQVDHGRTLGSGDVVLRLWVASDEDAELVADRLWSEGASAVGEERWDDGIVLTADLTKVPVGLEGRRHELVDDDGSWWDGWRPFARPVEVGPFFVRPPWVVADVPAGLVELQLDAGRAFGTGAHPSTRLALAALAERVSMGTSVLDVGCGSGALAVGSALLGAAPVVAFDIDPEAVAATLDNARRNDVEAAVRVHRPRTGREVRRRGRQRRCRARE